MVAFYRYRNHVRELRHTPYLCRHISFPHDQHSISPLSRRILLQKHKVLKKGNTWYKNLRWDTRRNYRNRHIWGFLLRRNPRRLVRTSPAHEPPPMERTRNQDHWSSRTSLCPLRSLKKSRDLQDRIQKIKYPKWVFYFKPLGETTLRTKYRQYSS